MSRFRKDERVQIIATISDYHLQYGTVIETLSASVRIRLDGVDSIMRFWDTELIPAPPLPVKELTKTQTYLRELDEDAKALTAASHLVPVNSALRKDLDAFAANQTKIVYNLKMLLSQDGVKLWEAEDGGK